MSLSEYENEFYSELKFFFKLHCNRQDVHFHQMIILSRDRFSEEKPKIST